MANFITCEGSILMAVIKSPLWWRVLRLIFDFLICFDVLLGYIPLLFFEYCADAAAPVSSLNQRQVRRYYLQAFIGPHVYATAAFLLVVLVKIHWCFLLSLMVFYCLGLGLFQLKSPFFYFLLKLDRSAITRTFARKITIIKFMFSAWAFLVIGLLLLLPSA